MSLLEQTNTLGGYAKKGMNGEQKSITELF
jgi:hypothetical protein